MALKLRRSYFSRDKEREEEYGSFFNKTSSGLTSLINILVALVFTPAIMATSVISKDMVLMIANISLSMGYIANFAYRFISREMSYSELFVTGTCLTLVLGLTIAFLPSVTVVNLINILNYANTIATALNGFFIIRNVLVPPIKKLSEGIAQYFGFEIGGNYFHRRPLSLSKDRFVIDRLFRKHYGHDSVESVDFEAELSPFNRLLNKLVSYINQDEEQVFGSILNADNITSNEKLINQLTIEGNDTNCISLLNRKIDFKLTKLSILREARQEVDTISSQVATSDLKSKLRFFTSVPSNLIQCDKEQLRLDALACIDAEIENQVHKVADLKLCIAP